MSNEYSDYLRRTRDSLARASGRHLWRARAADTDAAQADAVSAHQHNRGAARALDTALDKYASLRSRGWGEQAQGRLDGLAQVDGKLDDLGIAQAGSGAPAIVKRVGWLGMLWQESNGRARRLQRWARKAAQALRNADSDTGGPGAWTQHADALAPLLESLARGRVTDTRPHPLADAVLDALQAAGLDILADVYAIDRNCDAPVDGALLAWLDAGAPRMASDPTTAPRSDLMDRLFDADRAELTAYLEGRGFAVHDSETDDTLRTAALLDAEGQEVSDG
jgi:hypothetical protein